MSSMIHLARPKVPPVAITILVGTLFSFRDIEKWGRMYGRTDVQTTSAKIVITTGRAVRIKTVKHTRNKSLLYNLCHIKCNEIENVL